eukprot:TRINITY_DN24180_c0_g1_i1.p1 TRINITY_DN24180_c0_g1~~TRINITY_DN24180_c0_g1_i1.p1  ORF type:complete len:549 (-),score=81.19 TRINITY_DN24180_c0_g1_i1:22-1614(-)
MSCDELSCLPRRRCWSDVHDVKDVPPLLQGVSGVKVDASQSSVAAEVRNFITVPSTPSPLLYPSRNHCMFVPALSADLMGFDVTEMGSAMANNPYIDPGFFAMPLMPYYPMSGWQISSPLQRTLAQANMLAEGHVDSEQPICSIDPVGSKAIMDALMEGAHDVVGESLEAIDQKEEELECLEQRQAQQDDSRAAVANDNGRCADRVSDVPKMGHECGNRRHGHKTWDNGEKSRGWSGWSAGYWHRDTERWGSALLRGHDIGRDGHGTPKKQETRQTWDARGWWGAKWMEGSGRHDGARVQARKSDNADQISRKVQSEQEARRIANKSHSQVHDTWSKCDASVSRKNRHRVWSERLSPTLKTEEQHRELHAQDVAIQASKAPNRGSRGAHQSKEVPKGFTTVMCRNIPNKYTRDMLVKQLNKNFKGRFDFVYLPIDFRNRCNMGYGFINFCTFEACTEFIDRFDGVNASKCLPGLNSDKVVEVSQARVQGLKENVQRLRRSPVINALIAEPAWMPLLLDENGKELPFPISD